MHVLVKRISNVAAIELSLFEDPTDKDAYNLKEKELKTFIIVIQDKGYYFIMQF